MPSAVAMRTLLGRAFQHRGANALTGHFHQAEMRDTADLDAGAIVAERLLEAALDRAIVPLLVHVDVVDHDQAGEIAKPKLARDFFRRFAIGLERGVLDMVLARRAAG